MQANTSNLRSIYELLEYQYQIPSYQRGYRWTKYQVIELLDDIWEYAQKEKKKEEYYCLQPIVVVKIGEKIYSVIDGQQRLTTLLIILNTMQEVMRMLYKALTPYSINYQTREGSAKYLQTLDPALKMKNIDFYYMSEAKEAIQEWLDKNEDAKVKFLDVLLQKSTPNVQVIWYELDPNVNPIDVFTRLNMGKIGLTNAELIKALFLSSPTTGIKNEVKQAVIQKQSEIAGEWDRYEARLRNEEFWGFLQNGKEKYENHLDLLFELLEQRYGLKQGYERSKRERDRYHTFRFFSNEIGRSGQAWKIWDDEIKPLFQLLDDWFSHKQYYHLVGFLISTGVPLSNLIGESHNHTKREFLELLRVRVLQCIPEHIDQLNYQEDKKSLRNVLLLFNVLSILENPNSNLRFQFGRFKAESWDIEHIHSVKSEMPLALAHQLEWLKEVKTIIIDNSLLQEIDFFLSSPEDRDDFEPLYLKIVRVFTDDKELMEESVFDINDISNLTLLDAGTNRGYKNAVFPIKRRTIIEKDQKGTFIPLCTKNVFLKYYTPQIEKVTFWSEADRKNYKNTLIEVINQYKDGKVYEN